MPTLKITDGINAAVNVTPNDNSALVKYFKNLSDLSINGALLALRSGVGLDDPAINTIELAINFTEPVDVGTDQVDLKIGAGLNGTLGVFKPDGASGKLFDPDPYEDPIAVGIDERYVSFGVTANINAAATMTSGDLKFGFQAGARVAIVNYRPFTTRPSAPQLLDAVKDTVAGFVIPGDIEDLEALSLGTIVTLTGTGTLKFSATADLLAAVNPLASASLPAPLPTVALKGGGSITIGADVQITGEYQIRVLKYGERQVRLAYYRKSGEAFSVKVKASAGVSANVGESDVLGKLMSAISSDAKADAQEFEKAGLPLDQIKGIEDTVKGSIERTLEIAVTAELSRSQEHTAAFVYEIDLNALSATSRTAIHSALDGDLSALTLDPDSPLSGVRATHDVFTNVRQRKYALNINLLGIVNYGWLSKLVLAGKTMYEPTTGQLIISDSATASRIGLTVLNIGVADAEKLRHVMAENFLITVAYRGARSAGLQSTLTSSHSFFAMNQHTPPETVRDELDVSVALGLIDQNDERRIVTSAPEFGRTLFYAATHYDNTLSTELFLSADQARPVAFYEKAGLQALASLVHTGDPDDARLRPTQDPALWQQMKAVGQPGFKALFPGVAAPVVGAIVADYSVIRWWSDTMNATAEKLAEMQAFLAQHPNADDQNNDFKKLRSGLGTHLRSVAADTKENFGRPWGLLAMFIASGRRAGRKTMLISGSLSVALDAPVEAISKAGTR